MKGRVYSYGWRLEALEALENHAHWEFMRVLRCD